MNKEQIEERIKELENSKEQLRNNLIATEGALVDCKFWLEKLEEKE